MFNFENLSQACYMADKLGVTLPELEKVNKLFRDVLLRANDETSAIVLIAKSDLPEKLKLWCACKFSHACAVMPEIILMYRK